MSSYPPHWAYYMSLEDDLIEISGYVEICEENYDTFSTRLTRLLLAAASEVDVVAKQLCRQLEPTVKHHNIDSYRSTISKHFPAITTLQLGIRWNPLRVMPWSAWRANPLTNPDWWRSYNDVKHERDTNFKKGNLRNAIGAIAGLHCLVRHLEEDKSQPKQCRCLRIVNA
jgi:hypothetical protein